MRSNIAAFAGRHWFVPLFALLLAAAWLIGRSLEQTDWRTLEPALILDFVITIPTLFWLCYRKTMSAKTMALRLVALICAGLLIASWLIPESQQRLLTHILPLRWVGIAALVLVELGLLVTLFRAVFHKDANTDELAKLGAPPWIARLMLLEARFWRWVFSLFRR